MTMPGRGSTRARGRILASGTRAVALLAALAGLAGVIAPERVAASSYLFWSNGSGPSGPTVGRASLDGSGPNQTFASGIGGVVGSMVGGPNFAYWGTFPPYVAGNTRIGRVDLGGIAPDPAWKAFGSSSQDRGDLAFYENAVYWLNADSRRVGAAFPETGAHDGAVVEGTCQTPLAVGEECTVPAGLAVDASGIYWANDGTIWRADLGGNRDATAWASTGASSVGGLALDSGHLYFSNPTAGAIGRVDKSSRVVTSSFVQGLPVGTRPMGIAIYDGKLYWADQGTDAIGVTTTETGSPSNGALVSGASDPRGVAIAWSAPEAAVDPAALAFDPRSPGSGAGGWLAATVRNAGLEPLSLTSPSLSGSAASQFDFDASACLGSVLPPGGSCQVRARFSPTSPGRKTAVLRLPNDGVYSPKALALTGVGTPVVRITSAPAPVVRARAPKLVRFSFQVSVNPSSARIQCRLDASSWRPCSAQNYVSGLEPGSHSFSVRGLVEGVPGKVATHSWRLVAKKKKKKRKRR